MMSRNTLCLILSLAVAANSFAATTPAEPFRLGDKVPPLLENYCASCHDADEHKGDVRLDNLASLPLDARLDLLNRVQEQVFFGEMPPKKKKQPMEAERNLLAEWVSKELRAHNASKLEDKLRMPEYGNIVDHGKLFSGAYNDLPGFTPDRRWLISDFIFEDRFNRLTGFTPQRDIDGKRVKVLGDNNRGRPNLTNPFGLPAHSGVRYYDTGSLDGGHFLTMLSNSREVSRFMIERSKTSPYLPALTKIMAAEWGHEKVLAGRETYLKANIDPLLRELYQEKHDGLLPKFVPTKLEMPKEAARADGKAIGLQDFDSASPRGDMPEIWAAIRRHDTSGESDAAVIAKCERDWFISGIDDRIIQLRLNFIYFYLGELRKRMPKTFPAPLNPPAEQEMAIIRAALLKHRQVGDTYSAIIAKCMAEWSEQFKQERLKAGGTSDEATGNLVDQLFEKIMERAPTSQDKAEYVSLVQSYYPELGNEKAIRKLMETMLLRSDFVYRQEFGEGQADEHGRRMLSPRDASYALAYALTDSSPDKQLAEAAATGRLNTREDYRREVERMLKVRDQYYIVEEAVERGGADSFTNMPIRKLRFFREFFGYPGMLAIFKDNKRFGGNFGATAAPLVSEADKLVEHILLQDRNVFERLLTTEEFYVYHSGDNKVMRAASENIQKHYEYFKDKDWQNFDVAKFKEHAAFLKETPMRGMHKYNLDTDSGLQNLLPGFKINMKSYTIRLDKSQTAAVPFPAFSSHDATEAMTRSGKAMYGVEAAKSFNIDIANWNYPVEQPAKVEHRKGILTHPAWLMAFAKNTETDPVRRGKWVREKLLAGTVPDVPITVDAKIPEDHTNTLRSRLAKATEVEYCWKCHERMNPLGNSFEMYDDFGRFRTEESLEHPDNLVKKMPEKGPVQDDLRDIYKTLTVISNGSLVGSGDPALDGDVKDAMDLATRLGKSAKVRQSIIRHAFRYFMGRNEFLSDSKTLMDADEAYLKSSGSFDAVIISLLTSDSFIYRKPVIK